MTTNTTRNREAINADHKKACEDRLQIEFKIERLLQNCIKISQVEDKINKLIHEEEKYNKRINELMQEMIDLVNSDK